MWRFAPGKKPQKVDITPLQAILMATVTRGSTWQSITFANGSGGVWKAVLGTIPRRIEITIFGPLPRDEEIRAWLTPLLTIRGATEAFRRWPLQDAAPDGALVRIEFERKPVAPAPGGKSVGDDPLFPDEEEGAIRPRRPASDLSTGSGTEHFAK